MGQLQFAPQMTTSKGVIIHTKVLGPSKKGGQFLFWSRLFAVIIFFGIFAACSTTQNTRRPSYHWEKVRDIHIQLPPENVEGARDLGIRFTATDTFITFYDRVHQEWLEFSYPEGRFLRKYPVPYLKVATYRPFSFQLLNSQQVLFVVNAGNLQGQSYNHDSTFAVWSIGADSLDFIEMGKTPVSKTSRLSRDRYFIPFQRKPYTHGERLFFALHPFGYPEHRPGFCDSVSYHFGSVNLSGSEFRGYFAESLCREGKLYSKNHEANFTTPLRDSVIVLSTAYSPTLFRYNTKEFRTTDSSKALAPYFEANPLQNISPQIEGHELPNNDTSQPRYSKPDLFSDQLIIRSAKFPAELANRDPFLQEGWNHLFYNKELNMEAILPFPNDHWSISITNIKGHHFFRENDSPDGIIELKMMRLAKGPAPGSL